MAQGGRAALCRMGRKRQEGRLQSGRDHEGSQGQPDEVQVAVLEPTRPRARCAPLPLVGRGWGWGSLWRSQTSTPPPTPPPQGGRKQTGGSRSVVATHFQER